MILAPTAISTVVPGQISSFTTYYLNVLVRSFLNRANFSYGSIMAILPDVYTISENLNKLGETVQQLSPTQVELVKKVKENYWNVVENVHEVDSKVKLVQEAMQYEVGGQIILDLSVLLWNAWNIFSTYSMLMHSSVHNVIAINFIEESRPTWEFLLDKFIRWSSVKEKEREQSKNKLLLEQIRIERQLHKIELQCEKLQNQRGWKALLLGLNTVLLVTGVPAYTATWKILGTTAQIGTVVSSVGLSLTSICHLFQLVEIQKHLCRLRDQSELLHNYTNQICNATLDVVHEE